MKLCWYRALITCAVFGAVIAVQAEEAPEWNLEKQKDGIAVYSSPRKDSPLNAVRAEADVAATMEVLAAILLDPARRPQWDTLCKTNKPLDGEAPGLFHLVYDMPWPVSDRDMVVSRTVDRSRGQIFITETALEASIKPGRGIVRVSMADASWLLSANADGSTRLVTTAHLDPNGPIPAWLLNTLSVSQPIAMVEALRALTQP